MRPEQLDILIERYKQFFFQTERPWLKKSLARRILQFKQVKWAAQEDNKIRRL